MGLALARRGVAGAPSGGDFFASKARAARGPRGSRPPMQTATSMAYAHPIIISHLVGDPRFAMGVAMPPQSVGRRGAWTEDEDRSLVEAVHRGGTGNWNAIAAVVGRNQKRCRERWFNHLDTTMRKGEWTEEEDRIIDEAVARIGHKWVDIVKLLPPGRSGEAVKNRYKRARNVPRAISGDSVTLEVTALSGTETGGENRIQLLAEGADNGGEGTTDRPASKSRRRS